VLSNGCLLDADEQRSGGRFNENGCGVCRCGYVQVKAHRCTTALGRSSGTIRFDEDLRPWAFGCHAITVERATDSVVAAMDEGEFTRDLGPTPIVGVAVPKQFLSGFMFGTRKG
jgi:hypothetical protein